MVRITVATIALGVSAAAAGNAAEKRDIPKMATASRGVGGKSGVVRNRDSNASSIEASLSHLHNESGGMTFQGASI